MNAMQIIEAVKATPTMATTTSPSEIIRTLQTFICDETKAPNSGVKVSNCRHFRLSSYCGIQLNRPKIFSSTHRTGAAGQKKKVTDFQQMARIPERASLNSALSVAA